MPEGVHLLFLPPYSPELQPAERLWPLVRETLANRPFEDLDELGAALDDRCITLDQDPIRIKAYTRFHWWPAA